MRLVNKFISLYTESISLIIPSFSVAKLELRVLETEHDNDELVQLKSVLTFFQEGSIY
jgi:hypothetical protein